jgi:alkanesulfonate monooxygenase SsuD/methylene tetrahydromethanopterin reductase-like flavin-dependent oxidoreductase (luciferase family)
MKSAIWLPLFNDLADPRIVSRIAVAAEEAGWHGLFVWDHMLWQAPVESVADPWVTLSAAAALTETIRIGPMVTPLARRRPAKVARESAALDLLSGGRMVLGVGLGSDRFGEEFSRFGEETDERVRAAMVDESLTILKQAWTGTPVRHLGRHYRIDDVTFLPRPQQRSIPIWIAGFPGNAKPLRRAARFDGYFPVNLEHPEQLSEAVESVTAQRADHTAPYDVVIPLPPGADVAPYAAAGATWWATDFDHPQALAVDTVLGVIKDGPVP